MDETRSKDLHTVSMLLDYADQLSQTDTVPTHERLIELQKTFNDCAKIIQTHESLNGLRDILNHCAATMQDLCDKTQICNEI